MKKNIPSSLSDALTDVTIQSFEKELSALSESTALHRAAAKRRVSARRLSPVGIALFILLIALMISLGAVSVLGGELIHLKIQKRDGYYDVVSAGLPYGDPIGTYYKMTVAPDGYTLLYEQEGYQHWVYAEDGSALVFVQSSLSGRFTVDDDFTDQETVSLDEYEVTVLTDGKAVVFYWTDGACRYNVTCYRTLSYGEMEEIIQGLAAIDAPNDSRRLLS